MILGLEPSHVEEIPESTEPLCTSQFFKLPAKVGNVFKRVEIVGFSGLLSALHS
jgi:hypothetical protein